MADIISVSSMADNISVSSMDEDEWSSRLTAMEAWVVLGVEAPKAGLAVEFYKTVFGAVETSRFTFRHRESPPLLCVVLLFGTTKIAISDEINVGDGSKHGGIRLMSDQDLKEVVAKAERAGAVSAGDFSEDYMMPGKHMTKIRDPFGIVWSIVANLIAPAAGELGHVKLTEMNQIDDGALDFGPNPAVTTLRVLEESRKPTIRIVILSEEDTVENFLPGAITRSGDKAADFKLVCVLRKVRELTSLLIGQETLDEHVDVIVVDLDLLYKLKETEFNITRRRLPSDIPKIESTRTAANRELDGFYDALSVLPPWALIVGLSKSRISNKKAVKERRLAREAEFQTRGSGQWKTMILQKPTTEEKVDEILAEAISWRKEVMGLN